MKILAIESSCDETAAAVIENGRKICSNIINSQAEEHALYGGVVPEIASRGHVEAISGVAQAAVREAGLTMEEVDAIAATCAPGLIGALLVGSNYAKSLAWALQKSFIPVHHIRGHIAANLLAFPQLEPPFLCLSASGGSSMIVLVKDYTDMEILGGTRDDAAGEAFDKVARVLGVGYPGGPKIDKLAQGGNPKAYKLPHSHVDGCACWTFRFPVSKQPSLIWRTMQSRRENRWIAMTSRHRSSGRSAIRWCRASSSLQSRPACAVWSQPAVWRRILSCVQTLKNGRGIGVPIYMPPLRLVRRPMPR